MGLALSQRKIIFGVGHSASKVDLLLREQSRDLCLRYPIVTGTFDDPPPDGRIAFRFRECSNDFPFGSLAAVCLQRALSSRPSTCIKLCALQAEFRTEVGAGSTNKSEPFQNYCDLRRERRPFGGARMGWSMPAHASLVCMRVHRQRGALHRTPLPAAANEAHEAWLPVTRGTSAFSPMQWSRTDFCQAAVRVIAPKSLASTSPTAAPQSSTRAWSRMTRRGP